MRGNILVILQREFRISNNYSLSEGISKAENSGKNIYYTYIHDPKNQIGGANTLYLSFLLEKFKNNLQKQDSCLITVEGDYKEELSKLCKELDIGIIHYTLQIGSAFLKNEKDIIDTSYEFGIECLRYDTEGLLPTGSVNNLSGIGYKVFTPFSKKVFELEEEINNHLLSFKENQRVYKISNYKSKFPKSLMDIRNKKWAKNMTIDKRDWRDILMDFQTKIPEYKDKRDLPIEENISLLSTKLHFGEIDVKKLFLSHIEFKDWTRQLVWREFARDLLFRNPNLEKAPFVEKFTDESYRDNPEYIEAWCRGNTGIPFIDAGMRELWKTGFMHNRLRMIVASFLTKNLDTNWKNGAKWFFDTLTDADYPNNIMGWQWSAGCGVDASPYYRLFNPIVQSKKFDKNGEYIKKWIPELKDCPIEYIHEPWKFKEILSGLGINIGKDYPEPIIDIEESRKLHLNKVDFFKNNKLV